MKIYSEEQQAIALELMLLMVEQVDCKDYKRQDYIDLTIHQLVDDFMALANEL